MSDVNISISNHTHKLKMIFVCENYKIDDDENVNLVAFVCKGMLQPHL